MAEIWNDPGGLVRQYAPSVYRLAYARTGSRADAEDVMQEVFLRLIKAKPAFDSEAHAKDAQKALEDYVQGQIDANEDYGYRLAEVPKLKDAYIDVKGCTVLMVVANDLEAAKKAVDGKS